MSGVGEYKTRKGNMSGPSLVGFLAPDPHNECPKKAARGNGMPVSLSFMMKVKRCTQSSNAALPFQEVRHV